MEEENTILQDDIQQLMQNNTWWKEISDELDRIYWVHQASKVVSAEEKSEVIEAMFEYVFISEESLSQAQTDSVYKEAKDIIDSLSTGDQFPERLIELYQSKIPDALPRINQAAIQLINQLSDPSIRSEAERVWKYNRPALESIDINNLPAALYTRTYEGRYILRCICELQALDEHFRCNNLYPFGSQVYIPALVKDANSEQIDVVPGVGNQRTKYLAYRVYDPLWQERLERFEPKYVTYPLKWAGSVWDSTTLSKLYKQHKTGRDVSSVFAALYDDKERLKRLETAISSCPVTQSYGALFKEVVETFNDNRYRICSAVLLAMIEGLIWEFAWWWDIENGGLFDRKISRAEYKDSTKFELKKRDGAKKGGGRPNIGTLLKQTAFGEEVYFEIVEYLVAELFEERNLVLHGREPDYGSKKKAATLLFVVETLEKAITKNLMAQMGKTLIEQVKKSEAMESLHNTHDSRKEID